MTYSVAIRTLGLAHDTLRLVLQGIKNQTVQPEKVIVYIADGYPSPPWRVMKEQYINVPKGMMSQRALPYSEITSQYILMLDDDLFMTPGTAERLLGIAAEKGTALLGADPFANHNMSAKSKLLAAITSLVFPHHSNDKAFRLRPNGSFSYISSPNPEYYPSDTCAGPIMLWHRKSFLSLHSTDETWIDSLRFSYGDDSLLSYKATANGLKVGIDFGAEIHNLDSRTSSDRYRKDPERFYIRTKAMFATWWRMCYKPHGNNRPGSFRALIAGSLKFAWLTPVMLATSVFGLSAIPFRAYIRGLCDGYRYVHSPSFQSIPPYINL